MERTDLLARAIQAFEAHKKIYYKKGDYVGADFWDYAEIFEIADTYNTSVEIISEESEEGEMLMKAFGGIAALLRYRVQ